MPAVLKHAHEAMTLDEFLRWDAGDPSGALWQLIDSEPVAMAPASLVHGTIQSELCRLIGNHLAAHRRACSVVTAPGVVPFVRAGENFRIPDLGVTCSDRRDGHDLHEPVLLIEILSPSNAAETRANVWSYATIPSVREILVVHTARVEAELLRRDGADWPANAEVIGADGTLRLDCIGFSAPLRDAYRTSGLT